MADPTVNIVVGAADLPWIAGRLARELVRRLPAYGWQAGINGPAGAHVEYQQIVYGPPTGTGVKSVGLFTHGEDRAAQWTRAYDGHIALNPRIREVLRAASAPNPIVIEQAVGEEFLAYRSQSPIVFGVAGSVKAGGRKGEALVAQMVEHGYHVIAWGSGWPCPIWSAQYDVLPDFYRQIDYYIVTSSDEGGCTPILEAMACGKPVISPRIGFAIDRPVLEYEAGNWESLHRVLRYLTTPRTYDDWAREHAAYFTQVMG